MLLAPSLRFQLTAWSTFSIADRRAHDGASGRGLGSEHHHRHAEASPSETWGQMNFSRVFGMIWVFEVDEQFFFFFLSKMFLVGASASVFFDVSICLMFFAVF